MSSVVVPATSSTSGSGAALSARRAPGTAALRLIAKTPLSDDVVGLTFEDARGDRLAPWTPGSHIDLVLPTGAVRQYSLCGDRYDGFRYQVAVLREQDGRGGSSWIHEHAREGDELEYGGPRNHFPLVPADDYLFVAGGIGITPLVPMIEQAVATGVEWRLLYGGRRRTTMAFAQQLVERFGERITIAPHDEVGKPDLPRWLGEPQSRTRVYVCGPAGLIEAVRAACDGWPPYSFHSERFVAAVDSDAADKPFEIELARSGCRLEVAAGRSILDTLNEAGVTVLSSCRQGTCGTCEVPVLRGTPDHRDSVFSDVDREAGDCIITCVSRAQSDSLALDI